MNHCWGLFGTAARLALALGLHRTHLSTGKSSGAGNSSNDSGGPDSQIEIDCGRRTFWSAYCLDTHLSLTLGRPRIFHDEDIDQKFPSGTMESSISRYSVTSSDSLSTTTMLAPIAYYK